MPVDQLSGLASFIAPNFRAAPHLLVVDTDNMELVGIDASAGACGATPRHVDAIVCAGGMGRGMFNGLRSSGIRVFNTEAATAADVVSAWHANALEEVTEVECCGGGGHVESNAHAHTHSAEGGCGCSDQGHDAGHHPGAEHGAGGCCGQH